jgi:hypothetical protein
MAVEITVPKPTGRWLTAPKREQSAIPIGDGQTVASSLGRAMR